MDPAKRLELQTLEKICNRIQRNQKICARLAIFPLLAVPVQVICAENQVSLAILVAILIFASVIAVAVGYFGLMILKDNHRLQKLVNDTGSSTPDTA